jgi:hypothetical protein
MDLAPAHNNLSVSRLQLARFRSPRERANFLFLLFVGNFRLMTGPRFLKPQKVKNTGSALALFSTIRRFCGIKTNRRTPQMFPPSPGRFHFEVSAAIYKQSQALEMSDRVKVDDRIAAGG